MPTIPLLRRCSKCGNEYPATFDYFHRRGDGLLSICKECNKQKSREWAENNRERARARSAEYQRLHPEKHREIARRWEKNNPEKRNEIARKSRNKHIDRARETSRKWTEANRDKKRAYKVNRKAREANLAATLSGVDWQRALTYFNNCCAVCGRPQGLWHKIAADHWIPIASADCPGTIPTNIVPLCHSTWDGTGDCNRSKSNRIPHEWLRSKFDARKAAAILKRINTYFAWVKEQG